MDPPSEPRRQAETPLWKRIGRRLLFVLVGPPIAFVAGAIAGFVVGAAAAWIFSKNQDEFDTIRDTVAFYAGVAAAGYALFLALGGDRVMRAVTARIDAERRQALWLRANVVAAVALGIAAFFVFNVYPRLVSNGFLAAVLFFIGLPAAAYFTLQFSNQRPVLATWTAFTAAALLIVGARAIGDANELRYDNCWQIRESGDTSIWECTPRGGNPRQWLNIGEEGGSSRSCDQIDESSSGGTIWRCESDEF
jgi:MFS family permease